MDSEESDRSLKKNKGKEESLASFWGSGSGSGRLIRDSNQPSVSMFREEETEIVELSSDEEKGNFLTQSKDLSASASFSGNGSGKFSLGQPPAAGIDWNSVKFPETESIDWSSCDELSIGNFWKWKINQLPPVTGIDWNSVTFPETERFDWSSCDELSMGNFWKSNINQSPPVAGIGISGRKKTKARKVSEFLANLLAVFGGEDILIEIVADNLVLVDNVVHVEFGENDDLEDLDDKVIQNLVNLARKRRDKKIPVAGTESHDLSGEKLEKAEHVKEFLVRILKTLGGEEFVVKIAAEYKVTVFIGEDQVHVPFGYKVGLGLDDEAMKTLIPLVKERRRVRQLEIVKKNNLQETAKKIRLEAAKKAVRQDEEEPEDDSQFCMTIKMIRKRTPSFSEEEIGKPRGCTSRRAPLLADLVLNVLAKNSEAISTLEYISDPLKHKLSKKVGDLRKLDAKFLELLASGSPTEIRVMNASQITDEDAIRIFRNCNTKNLTVLQLDLGGACMPDYVLRTTLAKSRGCLPALTTVSFKGAYRITDDRLRELADAAPLLNSINLSQCNHVTEYGVNFLARRFESTLKELYLDGCEVNVMATLSALMKLKTLEVLSVAEIPSVCDEFVINIAEYCGKSIKELNLASCGNLTDLSLRRVGETCPELTAINLTEVVLLTDTTLRYLANGCHSIQKLKFSRNDFSDEAVAAFLEVSGGSLIELSLNAVGKVGLQTAFSLVKRARELRELDISWCRMFKPVEVKLIYDYCLSLRLLKVFGLAQELFADIEPNHQVLIIGMKYTPHFAGLGV